MLRSYISGGNSSLISPTKDARNNSRMLLIKGWKMQQIPFYKGLKKKIIFCNLKIH